MEVIAYLLKALEKVIIITVKIVSEGRHTYPRYVWHVEILNWEHIIGNLGGY